MDGQTWALMAAVRDGQRKLPSSPSVITAGTANLIRLQKMSRSFRVLRSPCLGSPKRECRPPRLGFFYGPRWLGRARASAKSRENPARDERCELLNSALIQVQRNGWVGELFAVA